MSGQKALTTVTTAPLRWLGLSALTSRDMRTGWRAGGILHSELILSSSRPSLGTTDLEEGPPIHQPRHLDRASVAARSTPSLEYAHANSEWTIATRSVADLPDPWCGTLRR